MAEVELVNPSGCPVLNYTDLDVAIAPAGSKFAMLDQLREQAPVFTGVAGEHQYFLLTRMEEIRASYQNAKVFTNASVTAAEPNPPFKWIPEMLDGKIHVAWRQLLGPLWTPAAIEKMEPKLRQRFAEVLDSVVAKGSCDLMADVALLYPNVIFMDLMGLPREDAEQFQAWEVAMLHNPNSTPEAMEEQFAVMNDVIAYFMALIQKRRAEPQDDMLSYVLAANIEGEPIPDEEILAFCLLMFLAGLDTVATQLTYNFWHLATHPEDRQRLLDDPSLIPNANEEFLRYYSFVTPSRKLSEDVEVAGCPMKAGQMVHLPLSAANRDPREFPDADKVLIDREGNRHAAFGLGPHRCLGSHLARAELRIAMEMWHERIPNYRVAEGSQVLEHGGQVGITALHLEWNV